MLKKTGLIIIAAALTLSCGGEKEGADTAPTAAPETTPKAEKIAPAQATEGEAMTVSELAKDLPSFEGKTVRVKGLVSHVCRKSGKKLFMVGPEEGKNFKIVPAGPISTFDIQLEGTEVTATGKLTRIAQEGGHDSNEEGENCTTKQITGYVLECVELTGGF